jgi:hypothetical protein
MNKRLSIFICLIISVAIFVSSCGMFLSYPKRVYPNPSLTLNRLLSAMADGDLATASVIAGEKIDINDSEYDEQTKDFIYYCFEVMTIKVNGEPVYSDEQVDLSVTVTTPDLEASMNAVLNRENNEFIVLLVKDMLLATINGEDTTSLEEEMDKKYLDEIKLEMAKPENQISSDSSMRMFLNEAGDDWIIDYVSEDFMNFESFDMSSDEVALAVETAVTDAIPDALDLLLTEGSIDQATYDTIISSL